MSKLVKLPDFVDPYVTATGLAKYADVNTDVGVAPNGVPSVKNQNGILNRALIMVQLKRARKLEYSLDNILTIKSLERLPGTPGLYNRQPGNPPLETDAQDNAVGLCALGSLSNYQEAALGMIRWAWDNLWCFNNMRPGIWMKECFRQGGDIGFYYLAAGRRSPFILTLWMLGGMLVNPIKKQEAWHWRLTWLRFWTIDNENPKGIQGFFQRFLYKKVKAYWTKKMILQWGGEAGILNFGPHHPMDILQKEIDGKSKV